MRRKALATLALAGSLIGCSLDMNFGPGLLAGDPPRSCSYFCIDFGLEAAGSSFLIGDTLNVSVLSTEGHSYATWSASGPSLAFVDGDSLAPLVNRPTHMVRVKALGTGNAELYAQAVGASLLDTLQLRVVDSSSITKVAITSYPTPTIKVGQDFIVSVQLSDTVSLVVGYATGLSSSDTTVLTRIIDTRWDNGRGTIVHGRAPGTANVTVNFRNLTSNTIQFTVIP